MRLRLTLILLVCNLAAAGVLLYLTQREGPQTPAEAEPMLPGASAIRQLEIRYPARDQRRMFALQEGRWQLAEPVEWWANRSAILPILAQLESLEAIARIPLDDLSRTNSSPASYGLAPPAIEVTFTPRDGEPVTLGIGENTSMGGRLYVLEPGGEAIAVVDAGLLDALDRPLRDFIDPALFDLDFFEIDSLGIQVNQQRTTLEKTEEGWAFATPLVAPADGEVVEALIGSLLGLQVGHLQSPEDTRPQVTGLDNPFLRLTLQAGDELRILVLGAEVPAAQLPEETPALRYARLEGASAPPTVFTLPADGFEIFRQAQELLRERRFWQFDPEAVTSARIDQNALGITLQKLEETEPGEAAAWQVLDRSAGSGVEPQPAEPELVDRWLRELSQLEAYRFVSDAPGPSDEADWGLADPRATITLETAEGTSRLVLGERAPGPPAFLYAKLADERFVYGVPPSSLLLAQANPLKFRDRTLYSLPESAELAQIRVFAANSPERILTLEPASEAGVWNAVGETLEETAREAAGELAGLLSSPEVQTYLNSRFTEPAEHAWAYRIEIDARLPGGEGGTVRTNRLWLTNRISGTQQIGGTRDPAGTFLLTQRMIDALTPLTFERRLRELPDTGQEVNDADVRPPNPRNEPSIAPLPAADGEAQTDG
ncbi:MAG: DUF4340 domain-containing protein [Opitutales bacterium]